MAFEEEIVEMVDTGYRNFGEGFNRYIKSIEGFSRISIEEEKELSQIVKNDADPDHVLSAIDKLVTSNLLLVVKFAINYYKFINKGEFELSLMDLISEGNVGLHRAARTFDSDKGKFATYATHFIKRWLQKGRHQNSFIHIPLNHFTIIHAVKKIRNDRFDIPDEELKKIADKNYTNVDHVKFVIRNYRKRVLSLDSPILYDSSYGGDDNHTGGVLEFYAANETPLADIIEQKESRAYLLEKIKTLKPIEQEVVLARYFGEEEMTYEELGEVWNVSKQRINQVLVSALKKLKMSISEDRALERVVNR